MKIFNPVKNKKIILKKETEVVKIFLCGPTVYESIHFGHARFLLFFDLVYRVFKFSNIKPIIAINITDIDPKISERAKKSKVNYSSIVDKNFKEFLSICKKLSIDKSFIYVKVSDYTSEAIKLIKFFLKKKMAYYSLGNVYLRVENTPLGKISNLKKEDFNDLRFDIHPGKQNIKDILLWNSTEVFENNFKEHELGNGIPWWHIQDISVIMGIFSGEYDIHGGATDLIIPHHEYINSILYQLKLKKKSPKFWLHVGLVYMKNKKMSKSSKNVVLVKDLLDKFNSNTIRLYCYSKNYRYPLVYSYKILEEYAILEKKIKEITLNSKRSQEDNKIIQIFINYLKDDFNTYGALRLLRKCIKEKKYYETKKMAEILGLQY